MSKYKVVIDKEGFSDVSTGAGYNKPTDGWNLLLTLSPTVAKQATIVYLKDLNKKYGLELLDKVLRIVEEENE